MIIYIIGKVEDGSWSFLVVFFQEKLKVSLAFEFQGFEREREDGRSWFINVLVVSNGFGCVLGCKSFLFA